MRPHAYFVILDLTVLRIAQQACMDEAEVSDVEEVFDHPRPLGAEEIWDRPESSGMRGHHHKQTGEDRPQVRPRQTQTMP